MFCLRRTCVLTSSSSETCGHTEDEVRAPTGTWVMDDVRLAVEKGYRILEVCEGTKIRSPITTPKQAKAEFSWTI